jgi:putative SOS response-associated peptidase YedK
MPAILTPEQEKVWLSDLPAEVLTETILKPLPANILSAYKVSTLVNSPEHDSLELIKSIK